MKNIDKEISEYRTLLMNLWNDNFAITNENSAYFNFEVDKAFSRIRDGLFESMVLAKTFEYAIEYDSKGFYYNEIIVKPKFDSINILISPRPGIDFGWESIDLQQDDSIFCFVDLFDWDISEKMDCEFIEAKLKSSATLKDHIGCSILFKFSDVNVEKKDD